MPPFAPSIDTRALSSHSRLLIPCRDVCEWRYADGSTTLFGEEMTLQATALVLLLAGFSFAKEGHSGQSVVELPRPNSGTFTTEEAEARKIEILSNKPTGKIIPWKNPFSGFSIHIHSDDSITVYGSSGRFVIELEKGNELTKQSVHEVRKLAESILLFGNPAGILITSDRPLKESKVIADVLAATFVPSIQLFYATTSEQ